MKHVELLKKELQKSFRNLPSDFYSSFRFTTTGNNLTHPVTLGYIVAAVWKVPGVKFVGVDVRLKESGARFYPDIVAFSSVDPKTPVLIIDYESPNSCDMRILKKDVNAYQRWSARANKRVPYVIITTLPDAPSPKWQLRYTSKLNASVKKRRPELRDNPKKFWYGIYSKQLKKPAMKNVYFLNISGKSINGVSVGR